MYHYAPLTKRQWEVYQILNNYINWHFAPIPGNKEQAMIMYKRDQNILGGLLNAKHYLHPEQYAALVQRVTDETDFDPTIPRHRRLLESISTS